MNERKNFKKLGNKKKERKKKRWKERKKNIQEDKKKEIQKTLQKQGNKTELKSKEYFPFCNTNDLPLACSHPRKRPKQFINEYYPIITLFETRQGHLLSNIN